MQRECKEDESLLFDHKAKDYIRRAAENIVATKAYCYFFILLELRIL
jgi:hypothetical protein